MLDAIGTIQTTKNEFFEDEDDDEEGEDDGLGEARRMSDSDMVLNRMIPSPRVHLD